MNKKSLLMMMVTICLIAVVGVGATLAYFTDSTEVLTNTFTLGKVDIEIDEPKWEENNPNPSDIVPGQTFDKDPTVTVKANSVDSYVFMSVIGIDAMEAAGFEIDEINAAWQKADETEGKDGIYVYSDANGDPAIYAQPDEDTALPALFTKVTYANNVEGSDLTFQIKVKAAAVQATGEEGYTYEKAYEQVVNALSTFEEATTEE